MLNLPWSLAGSDKNDTDGIVDGHAYSLIATRNNVCGNPANDLMLYRNPHGRTEFRGEWHDGSAEWTENPGAAAELHYTPDPNDGLFWISKRDAFKYFQSSVSSSASSGPAAPRPAPAAVLEHAVRRRDDGACRRAAPAAIGRS
jgi:hypothetical protein